MQTIDINKLTFTTKAEYIEWRAAWRQAYAALTDDIRRHKQARKPARPVTPASLTMAHQHANQAKWLRGKAADMLVVRAMSKERSQAQWLKERSNAAAICT